MSTIYLNTKDADEISEITPSLYIGSCFSDDVVAPDFITDIVSLVDYRKMTVNHHIRSFIQYGMWDDTTSPLDETAIAVISYWVSQRMYTGKVLVHCEAGINRSCFIAGLALVKHGYPSMTGRQAIDLIRKNRGPFTLKNTKFEAYLLNYK